MFKLTILYKKPSDPAKFDAHYFGTHMPLAGKIPGLVRAESVKAAPGMDGSEAPWYVVTELVFESAEAAGAAWGTPEGGAVMGDMVNFENDGMVMLSGDVAWTQP